MGFDPIFSDSGPCDLPSLNHENDDSEFVLAVRSSEKNTTAQMSHVRVMREQLKAGAAHLSGAKFG